MSSKNTLQVGNISANASAKKMTDRRKKEEILAENVKLKAELTKLNATLDHIEAEFREKEEENSQLSSRIESLESQLEAEKSRHDLDDLPSIRSAPGPSMNLNYSMDSTYIADMSFLKEGMVTVLDFVKVIH